jgi:hypothetical protein
MKTTIQVRKYGPGQTRYGYDGMGRITGDYGKFEVVTTIQRKVRSRMIGNFCPIFCTYKQAEHLVLGDTTLFIEEK